MNLNLPRGVRTAAMIATTAAILLIVTAGTASADPGAPGSAPGLSPFDLTDTHGIKISQYELNIDQGGWTDPGKSGWSFLIVMAWEIYRWFIGMVAWLLNWTVSFTWMDLLTKPLSAIGDSIESHIIGPSNLLTTAVILGAFGVGIFVARGHYGRAGVEFGIAAAILALATTGLAHPVTWVTSPDGPLNSARKAGIEIANVVTTNGATSSSDPESLKQNTSGVLIDTFIRQPHQLLNYGANIDSDAKCVDTYDKVLKAGPYGSDSAGRDQIGKCDEAYKKYAESPGPDQLATQGFLIPSGGLLALVIGLLALLMMASVALTGWAALKLIWHTIVGLIPGTSRRGLAKSLADVLVHLILIPILLVFLCSYLYILKSVMAANANIALVARFIVADLLLLVSLVVLWRLWRNHQQVSARFAELFNRASEAARNVNVGETARLMNTLNKSSTNPSVRNWSAPSNIRPATPTGSPRNQTGGASAPASGGARMKGLAGKARGKMEQSAVGREVLGIGRDTVATGKGIGKAGKTAMKYTVGAPVSYPAAAASAAGKWSAASSKRREAMKTKLGAAKDYAGSYRDNTKAAGRGVAKAGSKVGGTPVKFAAKTAAKAGTAALKKSHPAIAAAGLLATTVQARKTAAPTSVRRPHSPTPQTPQATKAATPRSRRPETVPTVVPGIGPRRPVQRRKADQMRSYLKSLSNPEESDS